MTKERMVGGTIVRFDDADFERFEKVSMYDDKQNERIVATKGKTRLGYVHRMIVNAPKGTYVSFINGNRYDMQRKNLRVSTSKHLATPATPPYIPPTVKTLPAPPVQSQSGMPLFVDIAGDGTMVVNVHQIASFNVSDPDVVLVYLVQQVYNPAGRDSQPISFALEGDAARAARLLVSDLTDPTRGKLIALVTSLQDRIAELEIQTTPDQSLTDDRDRLLKENAALAAKLRTISSALGG